MIAFLRDILYSFLGKRKLLGFEKDFIIGKEFCNSPMYSNRYIHVLHAVHLNGRQERIQVGNYCNLSLTVNLNDKGKVFIGDYVFMNSGCKFNIANTLRIGSNCMLGPGVIIWDSNNHPLSPIERHKQTQMIPHKKLNSFIGGGDITIEDDVWVGMESLILGNVKIGKGSVIAARSVVTKDVPPMVLAGGVPARIIKPLVE